MTTAQSSATHSQLDRTHRDMMNVYKIFIKVSAIVTITWAPNALSPHQLLKEWENRQVICLMKMYFWHHKQGRMVLKVLMSLNYFLIIRLTSVILVMSYLHYCPYFTTAWFFPQRSVMTQHAFVPTKNSRPKYKFQHSIYCTWPINWYRFKLVFAPISCDPYLIFEI